MRQIRQLTWYHWCCIAIPFIRCAEVAGNDLVPKFAEYGYTYQDAWYYVFVLSSFKVFDEKNTPFNFSISEVIGWVIAIIITALYEQRRFQAGG